MFVQAKRMTKALMLGQTVPHQIFRSKNKRPVQIYTWCKLQEQFRALGFTSNTISEDSSEVEREVVEKIRKTVEKLGFVLNTTLL